MDDCPHYSRRCAFLAPCCMKIYKCRFCHNDKEDHELVRTSVTVIICIQCEEKQDVGTHCVNCGIRFGMYACLECRLFDDQDKQQFHCDKCGACRIGGRENFFHCDNCDICLSNNLREGHACRPESGRDKCPVCFEHVHTAADSSFVPNCGHMIHMKCYKLIKQFGYGKCPICTRPYDDNNWRNAVQQTTQNAQDNNNNENVVN